MVEEDTVRLCGDAAEAKELFAMFDPIYDWKNDKALQALAEMIKAKDNVEPPRNKVRRNQQ